LLILLSLMVIVAILLGGALTLQAVQRGLDRILAATRRMREFDFAAAATRTAFSDVRAVMESLELTKTAMRAMSKYVPTDLVRQLYQGNREPTLGGALCEVTLLFSDIKDFTQISENMQVDALAKALGRYFEVMTDAVHHHGGIIDKYIGDSVMALWNVPTPRPDHARGACSAALACLRATRSLYESGPWTGAGTGAFPTRFGINTAQVMVGHFGAPDRMSYTAIGDGVNLASRLEGLNKQYGTSIIVSESTQQAAGDGFCFRLLDIVAVKGKAKGVRIFELCGEVSERDGFSGSIAAYENAWAAYARGDFDAAISLLEAQKGNDPPSRFLLARCIDLRRQPPPKGWDGVYISQIK
jgi:adenylate cyclase